MVNIQYVLFYLIINLPLKKIYYEFNVYLTFNDQILSYVQNQYPYVSE